MADQRDAVFGGMGVLAMRSKHGQHIYAPQPPFQWVHPFRVAMTSKNTAQIALGIVNEVEPKFNGKSFEKQGIGYPKQLQIDLPTMDEFYIALEIYSKPKWAGVDKVEIVCIADLATETGKSTGAQGADYRSTGVMPSLSNRRTRYPIAKVVRGTVYQIAHFNINYRAVPLAEDAALAKHFFFAK